MPQREHFAVLTVDDDARIRRTLRGVLEDEGHETGEAANAGEAYEALEKRRWDAVLLDLTMPGEHGLDALLKIREQAPDTAVIVVSGESTLENAVKAGQRGAFDFVPKPINDPEHLLEVLREAVKVTRLRRGAKPAPNGGGTGARSAGAGGAEGLSDAMATIVGDCPAVDRMREQIRRVAPSNGRVLITGENGAGKELAALAIHALSKRSGGAFVKLNCAAIPKDLLESELFGYEKGAFTGAVASKKGRLELADGGTLFLDEIGDLALDAQAKLLRALETGEILPVGADKPTAIQVRLIAATDANLEDQIRQGQFKAPLLHRLSGFEVRLPPLRERREDIGLLFHHFAREELEAVGEAHRLSPHDPYARPWLPAHVAAQLVRYAWPGNIRELRNVTRQLVIESRGLPQVRLDPRLAEQLGVPGSSREPIPVRPPSDPAIEVRRPPSDPAIEVKRSSDPVIEVKRPSDPAIEARRKPSDVTESELLEALRACAWDLKAAADRLRIPRPSIYDLIERSPNIRTAGDLGAEEITQCFHACGGDLDAMVTQLQVSKRALNRRLRELGLAGRTRTRSPSESDGDSS
jgi:two-component system nitrogen regulation response regulator GlnG